MKNWHWRDAIGRDSPQRVTPPAASAIPFSKSCPSRCAAARAGKQFCAASGEFLIPPERQAVNSDGWAGSENCETHGRHGRGRQVGWWLSFSIGHWSINIFHWKATTGRGGARHSCPKMINRKDAQNTERRGALGIDLATGSARYSAHERAH